MPELDNTSVIIIILGGLGFIGSIVYGMIRNRRRAKQFVEHSAQFETEASARGWTVESSRKHGEQHLFKGRSGGIDWAMEVHRHTESRGESGSSDVTWTRWQTDAVSLPGEVIVLLAIEGLERLNRRPKPGESVKKAGGATKQILQYHIKGLLRDDRKTIDLAERAALLEAGSVALRQRFNLILASTEAAASRFLGADFEALLTGWPEKPRLKGVVFSEKGIFVELGMVTDMATLDILVQMGTALAKTTR
jgi:hypothetical protein